MNTGPTPRPLALWALVACLLVLSIGGLYGGIAFLVDPSGRLLGMSPALIERVPVIDSYLLPGIFLLIIMGVLPLVLIVMLWRKPAWPALNAIERTTQAHWVWLATLAFSLVLLGWLAVQILLIGFYGGPQTATFAVGVLLLLLTLWPSVRRFYAMDQPPRLPARQP